MSWVTLAVLLVLGSYSWTPAGGQTCSLSGSYTCKVYCMQTILNLYVIFSTIESYIHTAPQFSFSSNVTVSAESVDGPTPAVRVTWSTTVPPQCVTSVRVEFRTSRMGPVVATNTTNNTSQTEVIQTGLQCATSYYIRVVVTGAASDGLHGTLSSSQVQVLVRGKEIVCMPGFS